MNRSSGTIRVRAAFPNPNLFITPGQFGRVRVPMSQLRPTLLVPDAAVVTDQSVKMLFTVGARRHRGAEAGRARSRSPATI